jgi:CubicO group peptidase (beta-lactamase class C family)
MNFEDLQKSWQSQDAAKKISINVDVLLNEVRRNQQNFRRMIFLRDVREAGIAALLVPVFIYGGWKTHWTLYLSAFACFVVGADMVLDRLQQGKKTPDLHGSLKDCAATSLAEICHQIWLLKNILWNYILPLSVPVLLFFCWCTWSMPASVTVRILFLLFLVGFSLLVDVFVYWLNQFAVRKGLEPRRQELEKLLNEFEPQKNSNDMKTKKPLGPLLLVLAVCMIAVIVHASMKTNSVTSSTSGTGIEAICKEHNLPALAVVVVKDGRICDRVAVGIRKWRDPMLVTTNDIFHIGSCTKSMTATLTAILIDEGKLRWDTTIAEVFPELKVRMDKQYETVTVEQLLHHRGGVPGAPPAAAWKRAWEEIGTPTQQRREFIEAVLCQPPDVAPGTKMIYSNQGYAIVGAMLEKITGLDYETLITEKLFKPLCMDTAGFGPPGTTNTVDQPWGHVQKLFMTIPMQTDNPPAIASAGRVHCSLDDLARFAIFHLQESATNGLLKPETLARLHAPPADVNIASPMDNYACGWVILQRGWAGGSVWWHNGSNGMWYIVMWLAPKKDFAVIAATNIAGTDAEQGCDEAATAMISKWLPK